jgi:hypothetical protein
MRAFSRVVVHQGVPDKFYCTAIMQTPKAGKGMRRFLQARG